MIEVGGLYIEADEIKAFFLEDVIDYSVPQGIGNAPRFYTSVNIVTSKGNTLSIRRNAEEIYVRLLELYEEEA